ncbi:MAG TPA: hypothetical protein EYP14_12485, partial [Planctomycetaceae bacterium]|nr:hypothetical protein [Planctomycetaceae bacterium]
MQTAVLKTERRVENTAELIRGVCRQFSEATGWPMHFRSIDEDAEEQDWLSASDDSSCCWQGEIHDGRRLLGYLRLDLPVEAAQDRGFVTVRNLAELIAELLNRLCSTVRVLESRTREVSTLVELGLTVPRESDVLDAVLRLLRAVTRLTGFRATGFFLLDPSTSQLNLRISHQLDAQRIPDPHRDLKGSPPDLRALMTGTVWLRRDQPGDERWLPDGTAIGVGVAVETHA